MSSPKLKSLVESSRLTFLPVDTFTFFTDVAVVPVGWRFPLSAFRGDPSLPTVSSPFALIFSGLLLLPLFAGAALLLSRSDGMFRLLSREGGDRDLEGDVLFRLDFFDLCWEEGGSSSVALSRLELRSWRWTAAERGEGFLPGLLPRRESRSEFPRRGAVGEGVGLHRLFAGGERERDRPRPDLGEGDEVPLRCDDVRRSDPLLESSLSSLSLSFFLRLCLSFLCFLRSPERDIVLAYDAQVARRLSDVPRAPRKPVVLISNILTRSSLTI